VFKYWPMVERFVKNVENPIIFLARDKDDPLKNPFIPSSYLMYFIMFIIPEFNNEPVILTFCFI